MSTSASPVFNGTSQFSSDLQQVLSRAVAIASLPLQQLNSQLTDLNSQSSALASLNSNFGAILSSLNSISSGINTPTATASATSVLTVQASASALPGTYAIHVITPGVHTTALSTTSLPTVSDPSSQSITSASSLTLSVGSSSFTINPSSNTLNSLADAINSSGSGVSATIINLGPSSAPNYRLSIQNDQLGDAPVQLNDGSHDLLQILQLGSVAQYQVNGQPSTPISTATSTITVAPGVTADLLQAGDSNIFVSRTSSSLSNALASFVAAYNAAVDAVTANRGSGGGALAGDSVVSTLQQSTQRLVNYNSGSGAVQGLADLGVSVDKTGHLSLDQTQLQSILATNGQDVQTFLGSTTSGGFLKAAADNLNGLEDPSTGTFQALNGSLQIQIGKKNDQIATEQNHIDLVQASLTAQISAADALIAGLEQQVSFVTSLFAAANGTKNN